MCIVEGTDVSKENNVTFGSWAAQESWRVREACPGSVADNSPVRDWTISVVNRKCLRSHVSRRHLINKASKCHLNSCVHLPTRRENAARATWERVLFPVAGPFLILSFMSHILALSSISSEFGSIELAFPKLLNSRASTLWGWESYPGLRYSHQTNPVCKIFPWAMILLLDIPPGNTWLPYFGFQHTQSPESCIVVKAHCFFSVNKTCALLRAGPTWPCWLRNFPGEKYSRIIKCLYSLDLLSY